MSISLTDAAAICVLGFWSWAPPRWALRFGVSRSGCSGWGYTVEVARKRTWMATWCSTTVRAHSWRPFSLPQVDGTRIDYAARFERAVRVRQPNVTGGCGCGSSFTTLADITTS